MWFPKENNPTKSMDIINIITRNHQLKDFFVNMVTWAFSDTRTNSVEDFLYYQNWETLTYHGFVVIITYWIQASLQLKRVKSLDLCLIFLDYLLLNLWVPHSSLFLSIGESSLVWFSFICFSKSQQCQWIFQIFNFLHILCPWDFCCHWEGW